ncbi:uncharacterized protein E0L32_004344 [Thyridium curvatum]|uniref:Uncharacterized protein n=1 Tax=Thyridium curvatum TaxID=1093900 RepID=A0A507B917_9PEZI|nr:uncharacterized protein E0L32_004344 [Thyridium curvatum]TPX15646.1 hypothetical protein E0L32_004344 [Thyridium curvatum]
MPSKNVGTMALWFMGATNADHVVYKTPSKQQRSRRPKRDRSNPKRRGPAPGPAQASEPEPQHVLPNTGQRETFGQVDMMPIHRGGYAGPHDAADHNINPGIQGATNETESRYEMPLARWLTQPMADEPYHTIGFVQVNQQANQQSAPFDPHATLGEDELQMDYSDRQQA